MRYPSFITVLSFTLFSTATTAAGLDTLEQKASYSIAFDVAERLKQQGADLDTQAFIQGIRDSMDGKTPRLDDQQRLQARTQYQLELQRKLEAEMNAMAGKNKAEGEAFLAGNASKEGITTTESGLQYRIIKAGTGKTPTVDDTVVTHYRGTLIDGREFDSSYKRNKPATFPVRGVIKGWTEALQLMKEGGKWELFIPSELAYGASKRSELIQPNSTLVFEIELLEVK